MQSFFALIQLSDVNKHIHTTYKVQSKNELARLRMSRTKYINISEMMCTYFWSWLYNERHLAYACMSYFRNLYCNELNYVQFFYGPYVHILSCTILEIPWCTICMVNEKRKDLQQCYFGTNVHRLWCFCAKFLRYHRIVMQSA